LRAIYECIESALQWYILFKTTLEKEGFKINNYDRCVTNKMINRKQCTISWYVDDAKLSHMDIKVVNVVLDMIKGHFGEIKVTRGKKHNFLGMNVRMREDGKLELDMEELLKEILEDFGEVLSGSVTSPAQRHLFEVNENVKSLDDEKSAHFHSIVQKLLYVVK